MKVSAMLSRDIFTTFTPSPAQSGKSLPTKTPGRDLRDRWSPDKLPDVGS